MHISSLTNTNKQVSMYFAKGTWIVYCEIATEYLIQSHCRNESLHLLARVLALPDFDLCNLCFNDP